MRLREVPFEEIDQSIDADLEAGSAPDLFRVTFQDVGFYASNGALLDLGDMLPAGYGDAFQEGFWQAVMFEDRPHGIPGTPTSPPCCSTATSSSARGSAASPTASRMRGPGRSSSTSCAACATAAATAAATACRRSG